MIILKKVLITGGQGDIAQAIEKKLLSFENQYEVRRPGKGEMDVTSVRSVTDYLDDFVPDVLINNAGYVLPQSIKDCNIESEKKTFEINLFGTFNCASAVLSKNKNVKIINIGSSAATKIHGTWSSYCSAKAAVVMATKCWAEDGIDAVCLSPGRTATKMRKGLYPNEDQKTLLNPDDFAVIVLYAIQGKYASGEHINVNLQNVEELINA